MRMLAGYMEKPNGFPTVQIPPYRGPMSLPPKIPSQSVHSSPIPADRPAYMPRSCSTNVLTEEQPSWLEDLLNEPETPVGKGHRRSASDPFAHLDANSRADELWLRSIVGGPTWGFPVRPNYFKGQAPGNRKSPSVSPPLPNGLTSAKEEADFKALGLCCSPTGPDKGAFVENEVQNQGDAPSHTEENSSGGSDSSQMKPTPAPPSAPKTDVKRKQHNARRSRVRKLQYIAELERNVQALQVEGAEVSAQLEFLDQQNLILGMENRALKQRLESLSQEQVIKSLEQEILDRELGRLQYLYHMQHMNHHQQRHRQKQHTAVHRRGRSCDLDAHLSKLNLNNPEAIAASNGFRGFPHGHRN